MVNINLENMSINELVELNKEIQKTLKTKRKRQNYMEFSQGHAKIYVELEQSRLDDGIEKYVLKVRNHSSGSFSAVFYSNDKKDFCEQIENLSLDLILCRDELQESKY